MSEVLNTPGERAFKLGAFARFRGQSLTAGGKQHGYAWGDDYWEEFREGWIAAQRAELLDTAKEDAAYV